jgi:hypothetical protein
MPSFNTALCYKAKTLDGRVTLYGATYEHRDAIKAAGGKWDPKEKHWCFPSGTDINFLPAGVLYVPPTAEELKARAAAAAAAAAAYVPPRRVSRDGRCCDHAEVFFPSDDPYAHYGPCHYRCKYHGVSKSNYSGT